MGLTKDIVAGLIATAVSGVALIVALGITAEHAWFLRRATTAPGTVVALENSRWSNSSRPGQFPVVEFSTRAGRTYRCEGSSSRPPQYHVSERVNVYYIPNDPDDARLDDFLELWLLAIVFGGVGALTFPLGALLLGLGIRQRRLRALRRSGLVMRGTVVHAKTSSVENWGKTVQFLTVETIDPATGAARRFTSHGVPGQGDQWLGKQLDVFVDRKNPKRFLVDAPTP